MKNLSILPLVLCLFLSMTSFAQTNYDAKLANKYQADDYGMKKYVIAFLKRGTDAEKYSQEERSEIQKGHMENIGQLVEDKKLILAGPFFGDGELRGIFVFDVKTLEEAKALTEKDPAIKAGVLKMELLEWYGSAGLMALPEIHEKIQKKSF